MRKLSVIILAALFTLSCGNAESRRNRQVREKVANEARAQADRYAGTYKGTLPCADCDGIEVTLHLKDNGKYHLKTRHIAGRNGQEDIHTEYDGYYTWNEAENTVTLGEINTQPNKYLYSDGNLIQLDMNGNRITGPLADKYVLKK